MSTMTSSSPGTVASPRNVAFTLAVVSGLATLWLPPLGAVCFIVTTVYAVRRVRNPFLTAVLVLLTVVAVAAAPGVLVTGHSGAHMGTVPAPHAPLGQ